MGWHFGYNCSHWVPGLSKCRVMIAKYNQRDDLLADKWLTAREILAYTERSPQELVGQVRSGDVQAKKLKKPMNPQRDGYFRFLLNCSWEWDNCALTETGGQCYYFKTHDGEKISCIADLRDLTAEHPNMAATASDDDMKCVEEGLSDLRVTATKPFLVIPESLQLLSE
ncbi:MAG TPA: hypothetical protein VIL79_09455 [Thermoleophilia bacterium]